MKVLVGLFFLYLGGSNLFPDLSDAWKGDDPLPRAVLDLVFIGVGAYVLYLASIAYVLISATTARYSALRIPENPFQEKSSTRKF
jgi:hypothetical protein